MRIAALAISAGLVVAITAATVGACLSGGAGGHVPHPAPRASGPSRFAQGVDSARVSLPAQSSAPAAQTGIPSADAVDSLLDGGAGTGASPASLANCQSPLAVIVGPPTDGVVFNNAMTSADAGHVDRTTLVLAAFESQHGQLRCCLEPWAEDPAAPDGKLLLIVELAPDGSVRHTAVDTARSTPIPAEATSCIVAVVSAATFPPSPVARSTVVEYPLKLTRTSN